MFSCFIEFFKVRVFRFLNVFGCGKVISLQNLLTQHFQHLFEVKMMF